MDPTQLEAVNIKCPYTLSTCPLFNPTFSLDEVQQPTNAPPSPTPPVLALPPLHQVFEAELQHQQKQPQPSNSLRLSPLAFSDYSLAPSPAPAPPFLAELAPRQRLPSPPALYKSQPGEGQQLYHSTHPLDLRREHQPTQQQQPFGSATGERRGTLGDWAASPLVDDGAMARSIGDGLSSGLLLDGPGVSDGRGGAGRRNSASGLVATGEDASSQRSEASTSLGRELPSTSVASGSRRGSTRSTTSLDEELENAAEPPSEVVTPFISKLHHLLSQPEYVEVIRWTDAGDAFVFAHTSPVLQDVFARFFRHSKIPSFVRQLNIYGFTRLSTLSLLSAIQSTNPALSLSHSTPSASDYSAFTHPLMHRDGDPAHLARIKPKAVKGSAGAKRKNVGKDGSKAGGVRKRVGV